MMKDREIEDYRVLDHIVFLFQQKHVNSKP